MPIEESALRKAIGKNIASYRKSHKDTQASLGEKLNYTDKAVSKWERGESIPDVYVLSCIAELYGITVGNLTCRAVTVAHCIYIKNGLHLLRQGCNLPYFVKYTF